MSKTDLAVKSNGINLTTIKNMPDNELEQRLEELLGLSSDCLLETALIVAELEARGKDLSFIRAGYLPILRMVASRRLLPEIVVRYGGIRRVLECLSWSPKEVQRSIINGEGIDTVVYGTDASMTIAKLEPFNMTPEQLKQVFAKDHVRTQEEQTAILLGERTKRLRSRPNRVGVFEIDRPRKVVIVRAKRGTEVSFKDVEELAKSL